MIPRILHQIWVGTAPVPERWAQAWRDMHLGWEYRLWREPDIAALGLENSLAFATYMATVRPYGAADVARVEILYREGGVYVDIDSRPLRSLEGAPFMDAGFFAGYENPNHPGRIANGTMGAVAGHPVLRTYIDLIRDADVLEPAWDTVGGTALTRAVAMHAERDDIAILPCRTFYPHNLDGDAPGDEESYTDHFWASTLGGYAA